MSTSPFDGATRDPIALLEQLIGQVGGLKNQMDEFRRELKQEISEVRRELKRDISEVKQELGLARADITRVGSDLIRFASSVDKEQEAYKQHVEATLDRKNVAARNEWQTKYSEMERRVADLEEAERRRKEGKGA